MQIAWLVALCLGLLACSSHELHLRTPSEAMSPTLYLGENFTVDTEAYRSTAPGRGDVVVFPVARGKHGEVFPADQRPELPRSIFVKRIVGIPGDTIAFQGNEVVLNGKVLGKRQTGEAFVDCKGLAATIYATEIEGHAYRIAQDEVQARVAPTEPVVVPPGRYYVLGDNRSRSNDSRVWGTVARESILGRVDRIYASRAPAGCPPIPDRSGTEVR